MARTKTKTDAEFAQEIKDKYGIKHLKCSDVWHGLSAAHIIALRRIGEKLAHGYFSLEAYYGEKVTPLPEELKAPKAAAKKAAPKAEKKKKPKAEKAAAKKASTNVTAYESLDALRADFEEAGVITVSKTGDNFTNKFGEWTMGNGFVIRSQASKNDAGEEIFSGETVSFKEVKELLETEATA